jgi:hypothetical protein
MSVFTPGAYAYPTDDAAGVDFDLWNRLKGNDVAKMEGNERDEYIEARDAFVHACAGVRRNHKLLDRRHKAARAWTEAQVRAGRTDWPAEVPEAWMKAHGADLVAAAPAPRAREAKSSSERREDRGHSSRLDDPHIAAPGLPGAKDDDELTAESYGRGARS